MADNDTQFTDAGFQDLAEKFDIKIHFALVAYAQSNRKVEVSNRTIKEKIKKRLEKSKGNGPRS